MENKYLFVIKIFGVFLLSILIFFFEINTAFAHAPHDVIEEVEIFPTNDQDETLLIIARANLLKSIDGGRSWKRMVKGLDNKNRLSSLDISPQTQKTIYLSSLGDGIYKSEDEGNSWLKINNGLGILDIDLISVISDDIVLAAGTEKGLYKTKNGGESWSQVMGGQSKITAIASDPDKKEYVLIGDNQGTLYLSQDGGEVWKQHFALTDNGPIRAIAISPNFSADKTFFVGTAHGGIYKTFDGGSSLSEINSGVADKTIMSLEISPNYGTDSTIFASSWSEGAFYSNDGGNSWKKYTEGLTKNRQAYTSRNPHFADLSISSNFGKDKTIYLAGFDGLFKSTDGGRVWWEIETLSSRIIVGLDLSPDYLNDSTVAFTTYLGGAYLSNDQGATWKAVNNGLEEPRRYLSRPGDIARLFDIVFSPNYRSDNTIFSALWSQFLRSTSRGKHWDKVSLPLTQKYGLKLVTAISRNFASDRTIYLGTAKGEIYRSIDGGKSFSFVGNIGRRIHSLAISPDFTSDRTLYAGVGHWDAGGGVYKTVDGGYTWQPASNGIALVERKIDISRTIDLGRKWKAPIDFAISPSYKVDGTVFAGTSEGIFKTTDRGKSWAKLAGTAYGRDGPIEAIAISPNYQSDGTLIVSVKGKGLFKTVDGGGTFKRIGHDLINNNYSLSNMEHSNSTSTPIRFSPSYAIDQTIYGYSGTELFRSTDGGETWESIAIPRSANNSLMTYLYIRLVNFPKHRFIPALIAALTAALFSCLIVGAFGLKRKLHYSNLQISMVVALATLILVLIVLSV